jgi:hypothetical protein
MVSWKTKACGIFIFRSGMVELRIKNYSKASEMDLGLVM